MEIRLTELNNKSRKGEYIYVKEKGFRGAYYKRKAGVPVDAYQAFYEKTYKKKQKGKLREYEKAYSEREKYKGDKHIQKMVKRYVEKTRKGGKLIKSFKKGIATATIADVHNVTDAALQKAKEKMFRHLVLNKDLLKLITRDENLDKLSARFSYFLTIRGEDGAELATAEKHNKRIKDVIQELREWLKRGEEVRKEGVTDPVSNKLKKMDWNMIQVKKSGHLKRIELRIEFAKGR